MTHTLTGLALTCQSCFWGRSFLNVLINFRAYTFERGWNNMIFNIQYKDFICHNDILEPLAI